MQLMGVIRSQLISILPQLIANSKKKSFVGGNPLINGGYPKKGPVMRQAFLGFDVIMVQAGNTPVSQDVTHTR